MWTQPVELVLSVYTDTVYTEALLQWTLKFILLMRFSGSRAGQGLICPAGSSLTSASTGCTFVDDEPRGMGGPEL